MRGEVKIMQKKLEQLLADRMEAIDVRRESEQQLTDLVLNFDGSVRDALREGLVRLNFPAPAGFYRHIRTKD